MPPLSRRSFLRAGSGATALALMSPGVFATKCSDDGGKNQIPPDAVVHAILSDKLTDFYEMGRQAARDLGLTGTALAGATVFLKPNFVAIGMKMLGCPYDPTTGEVTKPELVAAIAEQCLEAGAAKVIIGEGAQSKLWNWESVTFIPGHEIGGATNMLEAANRLKTLYGDEKVELICLNYANEWVYIPSSSPAENTKDGIAVGKSWAEADHVISIPTIKTHVFAKMTASLKNNFGVASLTIHGNSISRCKLHLAYDGLAMGGIADAGVSGSFVDMYKWRKEQGRQDFAIVDGFIGLEGNGPHKAPVNDGRTVHFAERNAAKSYFVLASDDYVATDTTIASIINIPWTEIKALQMCDNLGLGATKNIELRGTSIEDIMVEDWMLPELIPESTFLDTCSS